MLRKSRKAEHRDTILVTRDTLDVSVWLIQLRAALSNITSNGKDHDEVEEYNHDIKNIGQTQRDLP